MGKSQDTLGYPRQIFTGVIEDKHLCEKCRLVLRGPIQGPCGHRYCRACAEALAAASPSQRTVCPVCQEAGEEDPGVLSLQTISPDHAKRRELEKLQVSCLNENCGWAGTLRQYEKHEQSCPHRPVTCECGETVSAELLDKHKATSCHQAGTNIDELSRKVQELELKVTKSPASYLHQIQQLSDKVISLERKIKAGASISGGTLDGNSYATYEDLEKYKQVIKGMVQKLSVYESMNSVLNNQIEYAVKKLKENEAKLEEAVQRNKQLENKLHTMERVQAHFEIRLSELDILSRSLEQYISFNGVLYWRVDNWKRCTTEAIEEKVLSLFSPPFYTGRFGYKMCMRLYPQGDGMGKGTHLSLFFVVMKGPCDPLLPWPFVNRVTMTLLDQTSTRDDWSDSFTPDPNSSSFQKPVKEMNVASGCPKFYSLDLLSDKAEKYLKDDTLFIKVTVDTKDIPLR